MIPAARASPRDDAKGSETRKLPRSASLKPVNFSLSAYTLVEISVLEAEPISFYIPKTVAQALACSEARYWLDAMAAEMKSLEEVKVFKWVNCRPNPVQMGL